MVPRRSWPSDSLKLLIYPNRGDNPITRVAHHSQALDRISQTSSRGVWIGSLVPYHTHVLLAPCINEQMVLTSQSV